MRHGVQRGSRSNPLHRGHRARETLTVRKSNAMLEILEPKWLEPKLLSSLSTMVAILLRRRTGPGRAASPTRWPRYPHCASRFTSIKTSAGHKKQPHWTESTVAALPISSWMGIRFFEVQKPSLGIQKTQVIFWDTKYFFFGIQKMLLTFFEVKGASPIV